MRKSKRNPVMGYISIMNATETTRFSSLIRKLLDQIEDENRLGQDGQAIVNLDQQSVGRLSRMDALQNQAMAKAQQIRRDQHATQLRAALQRMDQGEYGYCIDCGADIATKRLELDPAALKCISCASG